MTTGNKVASLFPIAPSNARNSAQYRTEIVGVLMPYPEAKNARSMCKYAPVRKSLRAVMYLYNLVV